MAKDKKKKPEKKQEEKSGYDWILATRYANRIEMRYRGTDLKVDGSDTIDDEGIDNWPDKDVREAVCRHLCIDVKFAHEVSLELG